MSHQKVKDIMYAAYALSVFANIMMVGRKRSPVTPLGAVYGAVVAALCVWAVSTL